MARRGENIYRRKDGRYEGRFIRGHKQNGKIWWGYVYGSDYKDVKRRLEQKKAERPGNAVLKQPDCTLSDWTAYWLEVLMRPHIKISTYACYRRMASKYVLPYFKGKAMQNITSRDCQAFVDDLGTRLSASTAKGICRMLKALLLDAVKHRRLHATPYAGVREPKAKRAKPRVLTVQEQQRIEKLALKTGQLEYLLFLYTGLRLGEMCALQWENIDFAENIIRVEATVQRIPVGANGKKTSVHFGTPKSDAGARAVPLPLFLAALLKKKYIKEGGQPGQFFLHTKGGKQLDTRTLQQRFARLAARLHLKGAHVHTLRHTYAARCREKGIGYEVIAELMGHSSPSMTIQFYGGCTAQQKLESVQRLRLIA